MITQTEIKQRSAMQADQEWWRGAAIYHVYPLSFFDSDGNGYGDLAGVAQQLDYIKLLGVDAIWLSPFYKSPMRDFGYDISDYHDVDPIFGRLADFEALVEKAHALGLKVIIDQVYSHTSDQHKWFIESRRDRSNAKADWYVWADAKPDGSPPNNWQSVFMASAWTWDARRSQYYLNNFQTGQPDLNVHNPEVQAALLDVASFWLDRGVDGFRLDAINFTMHDPQLRDNPPVVGPSKRGRPFDFQHHIFNQSHADIPRFLERVRALCDARGATFLVAEVGGEQADREMKLYTQGPNRLHSAYGFQFLYADRLTPSLVRQASNNWPGAAGEGWPSWAFSNHDAPRVVSRWSHNRDERAFAKIAMLLLATLRGSIFVYQGEELGLPQGDVPLERLRDPEAIANWPLTLGRDGARTPMPWRAAAANAGFSAGEPWLPVDPTHLALAVDMQDRDPNSVLHLTRAALALRKQLPALRTGAIRFLDAPEPVLAFVRGEGRDCALCVFNLGARSVAWPLPQGWRPVRTLNMSDDTSLEHLPGLAAIVAQPA